MSTGMSENWGLTLSALSLLYSMAAACRVIPLLNAAMRTLKWPSLFLTHGPVCGAAGQVP